MKKYVSDLIKLDDIKQWKNNDTILIKSFYRNKASLIYEVSFLCRKTQISRLG